jgi:hypothetical protein
MSRLNLVLPGVSVTHASTYTRTTVADSSAKKGEDNASESAQATSGALNTKASISKPAAARSQDQDNASESVDATSSVLNAKASMLATAAKAQDEDYASKSAQSTTNVLNAKAIDPSTHIGIFVPANAIST